jgi:hypothetical protein
MNSSKAKIDFTKEADGNLSPIARNVHTLMVASAATFASPPILMPAFLITINDYDAKLAAAQNRGLTEVTAKNDARLAVEGALRVLGNYVNSVAQGDLAIIELSGFPSYATRAVHGKDLGLQSNVSFIPQDLTMSQGNGSGVARLDWVSDGTRTGCELQMNTGDPNSEAGWGYKGSFTGGKCVVSGFTPGATLWARVRKIGLHGETGAWSDPATMMVT